MGATIAKYSSRGAEVALLIVTDGSTAQYSQNENLQGIISAKKEETKKCADILGIKHIFYGGLPDMRLDVTPHIEINAVIESVISEFKPSIVYTHFDGDVNKDHQCVYESTLVACRPVNGQCVKKIFAYSVPSSTEWNVQKSNTVFTPNWYEDIGDYRRVKYEAFSCYATEIRPYPHPRSVEYLRAVDSVEGLKIGVEAAESFVLLRSIT